MTEGKDNKCKKLSRGYAAHHFSIY